MLISGHQLRNAVKRWTTRADILSKSFPDSIFSFDDEDKSDPSNIGKDFNQAWKMVSLAQAAQQIFNAKTMVEVQGERISLALAVKLVEGAGRSEKMWRTAASDNGRDRYSSRNMERSKDVIMAKRCISKATALVRAEEAIKYADALRYAIGEGNMSKIEMDIPKEMID